MKYIIAATVVSIGLINICHAEDFKLTPEQSRTLSMITRAEWAGNDDHCPRFRIIEKNVIRELLSAGLRDQEIKTEAFEFSRKMGIAVAIVKYRQNPSEYCDAAWHMFGPDGFYKRQLLEAN